MLLQSNTVGAADDSGTVRTQQAIEEPVQSQMLWDRRAIREVLKDSRRFRRLDPLRAEDLDARGGLPALYRFWASCGLSTAQRELLELLQQQPGESAAFYCEALHICDSTYYERLNLLCERLAEYLNDADWGEVERTWQEESTARLINVPAPLTSLVGREAEVTAISDLLSRPDVRLITLTGPGGIGKTRVAIEVATRVIETFGDGICFVSLAAINEPAVVDDAIAEALGVKETDDQLIRERLKDFLHKRSVLLVIDNFEHLIPAACVVAELLAAAPRLKLLITSREVLRLSGEHEFPITALPLPDLLGERQIPFETLIEYEAIRLFEARASAVNPAFRLTPENVRAVAEICARVDGLPLGIELAAVRCKVLTPQEALPLLKNRDKLLKGRMRDVPRRQQTLRDAIDWSYQLLEPAEQRLFARLAVFVGGCTLEAAEVVCNSDGDLGIEVLDGLVTLVEKNLLRRQLGSDGRSRFLMLETIHEYALDRLRAFDEEDLLGERYVRYYMDLAVELAPKLSQPRRGHWMTLLETEHDNLRNALQWLLDRDRCETMLRLAAALWPFWKAYGHISEGRHWLETVLAHCGCTPNSPQAAVRAKALEGAGTLALDQSDYERARVHYEEGLLLWRACDDRAKIAAALSRLGDVFTYLGEYEQGFALLEEGLALARAHGDANLLARVLMTMGVVMRHTCNEQRAAAYLEESLALFRQTRSVSGCVWALNHLSAVMLQQGQVLQAAELCEESRVFQAQLDVEDRRATAVSLFILGGAALMQRDYLRAAELLRDSLYIHSRVGNKEGIAWGLILLATVAHAADDLERAARLIGASERILDLANHPPAPTMRGLVDEQAGLLRSLLGASGWRMAWGEGYAMELDQAVAYALAEVPLLV